jgi:O-antigen ligase
MINKGSKLIQFQRLEKLISVFLFVALFMFVLDFAISKSLNKIAIIIIKAGVSFLLLKRVYEYFTQRKVLLPSGMLIVTVIPVLLILLDALPQAGVSEKYYIKQLISAVFIIIAVWMIPCEWEHQAPRLLRYSLFILLLVASVSNFIAVLFYSLPHGLTSNPHYLSLQAIMVIPTTIYLFKSSDIFFRTLLVFVFIMELYLLLVSESRTAWLALVTGCIIALPFIRLKTRLLAVVILIFVPFFIYYFGILGADVRIDDLLNNITKEERVTIWSDAIAMQQDSDLFHWVFGHGLGSFVHDFQAYSSFHDPSYIGETIDFFSPHNFIIEILYTSGITGLILVLIGELLFVYVLLRLWWNTSFDSQKILVVLILVLFVTHFIHTFLTISFFSKQSIYFLAVFIGVGFYLFKRENYLTGNIDGS